MSPHDDLVATLKAQAVAQNLRERAFDGCRQWIRDGTEEGTDGLGGWSAEEIEVHFDSCSVVFDHAILSYPYVDTRLGLYVRDGTGFYSRDLRPIGYYRLITFLDGRVDDDYFVIEMNKPAGD